MRLRTVSRPPVRRLVLLGAGVFLLWMALQWATAPSPEPAQRPLLAADSSHALPVSPSASSPLRFRYVAVLLILTAGALLALYWHQRHRPLNHPALLRPIGQLALGPGQQIRLVACGDELLVLGVTAHQITLLKSLPLPPELQANGIETAETGKFARLLTHLSARTAQQTDHAS